MAKPIEMNIKEDSGYEVLYPLVRVDSITNIEDLTGNYYTKEQILTAGVCDLLGIPQDSEPKDAFTKLGLGVGKYAYEINLKDPKGNPITGLNVKGIQTIDGSECMLDENGYVLGVSEDPSVNITITSPYYDLNSISQELVSTGIITTFDLTMSEKYTDGQIIDFNSSQGGIVFSKVISTVDFCAVGGGGDGSSAINPHGGHGGGGGYVKNLLGDSIESNKYDITIGSKNRGNGGTVTIKKNSSKLIDASGGEVGGNNMQGGKGNGVGGSPGGYSDLKEPTSGTGYIFNEPSLGGVGGGGGYGYYYNRADSSWKIGSYGASPNGGSGSRSFGAVGGNGRGPGGGGGGGGAGEGSVTIEGGTGYPALAKIRLHFV